MTVQFCPYQHPGDYQRVSEFLITHHQPGNLDDNWFEPVWEYMHFHPALEATYWTESAYGRPPGTALPSATMKDSSARRSFSSTPPIVICEVKARGYQKDLQDTRPLYRFDIPTSFPPIPLTEDFRLTSLAEECDWAKVQHVMWRGFDHGDDVPMTETDLAERRRMFDTPKALRELKVVVAAPNGDFVAFCGMFYEPSGNFAIIEPVATDPTYRRKGLGKAAVLEGIRRCGVLGATVAYVGSDQTFYQAVGFRKVYHSECWAKFFD